jgi:hypothetical protein
MTTARVATEVGVVVVVVGSEVGEQVLSFLGLKALKEGAHGRIVPANEHGVGIGLGG